jgi:hypothetical protein
MPIWIANHSFTSSHTTSRILSLIASGPYYFSLSRTNRWGVPIVGSGMFTPPPTPLFSDTLIPSEILVYKRAYQVLGAFRNPCGLKGLPSGPNNEEERWTLISPLDVLLKPDGTYIPQLTHLYISLLVEEADHGAPYSNIVGLHSNLQLTLDANPDGVTYPPSMVTSSGVLHWLAYTSPIERVIRLRHEVSFLLTTN